MKTYGGSFGGEQGLLKKELETAIDQNNPTNQEHSTAVKTVSEAIQAVFFISSTDSKQFSKLKNTLKEGYGKGRDYYPTTLSQALNLLNIHKSTLPRHYNNKIRQDERIAFIPTNIPDKEKKPRKYFI